MRASKPVRATWLKYCDTTSENWWTTVNTKLNLNSRDIGLLAANPDLRVVLEWTIAGSGLVNADVIPLKTKNPLPNRK